MSERPRSVARLLLPVALATLVGCGGGSHPDAEATPTPKAPESPAGLAISAQNLAAVRTVLGAADRLDGAADGVVERCAGCALRMDGSADHAVVVADHTLHFCSDGCRKRFAEGAEQALLALELPGS